MSTDTTVDQLDHDSAEAAKLFADAFNTASKVETRVDTPVAVTEVAPPEPAAVEPVVAEATPAPAAAIEAVADAKVEAVKTEEAKVYNVPDWAKDLPDTAKEQLSKELQEKLYFQQKVKSEAGRQAALQKKLYDERQANAELRSRIQKPQDPALAAAAKADQAKSLAEWNALIEADPNLAKAIESRLGLETNTLKNEIKGEIDNTVNPLKQRNEQEYVDEQRKLLLEEVPNFTDVVTSPVYKRWLDTRAAAGIRNLAFTSQDHQDALTVLRVYAQEAPSVYNDMVRAGELPAEESQPVQATAPVQIANDTAHADKVAQARAQKVTAAPVVQNAPNPIAAPTSTPFANNRPGGQIDIDDATVKALFEAEYKKAQRVR